MSEFISSRRKLLFFSFIIFFIIFFILFNFKNSLNEAEMVVESYITFVSENDLKALDLIENSSYSEKEWENLKNNIKSEILQQKNLKFIKIINSKTKKIDNITYEVHAKVTSEGIENELHFVVKKNNDKYKILF